MAVIISTKLVQCSGWRLTSQNNLRASYTNMAKDKQQFSHSADDLYLGCAEESCQAYVERKWYIQSFLLHWEMTPFVQVQTVGFMS